MARTPQDHGRDFMSGVLQHLPDALRSQFESYIGTPDAAGFLTELGNGALRQSDYSRAMNQVQQSHADLKAWHKQLSDWAAENADTPAPIAPTATATATGTPASPSAGLLSKDDVKSVIDQEIGRREIYFAAFTADAVKLAQQHQQKFGEPLDIHQILQHPRLAELRLEGAYEDLYRSRLDQHRETLAAADRKKLEAEIRNQILTEIRQTPASRGLPYVTGEGSPLDHLTPAGETAKPFDPNEAAAMYDSLVAGKA